MKKLLKIRAVLMMMAFLWLSGCVMDTDDNVETLSETKFIMGTVVTIQLFDTSDSQLLDESFRIIGEVEDKMSLNVEGSVINALNDAAGKGPFEVDEDVFYVIDRSVIYSQMSAGGFDVTMEPVIGLWNIGTEEASVPEKGELEEALSYVGYEHLELSAADKTVVLDEGMAVNLGAIAKGYAADRVEEYLRGQGIEKAILNLGGNIVAIGEKDHGTPFRVGLQHPFDSRNEYFGIASVSDKTVVTSGIYERNFEQDGVLYHHILDTQSGYPVDNGVVSVSVIAESSIDADALSTVLFVLGTEKGITLCDSLEGVDCIYVTDDWEVILSEGAGEMFKLSDDGFSLVE